MSFQAEKINPIYRDLFYHEGRGPELVQVHYRGKGKILLAIDFYNPDETAINHIKFDNAQIFMFTPEEVYNYQTRLVNWGLYQNAAIVKLTGSTWLKSFAPQHLTKCDHYQLIFYDEILDVICESINIHTGNYLTST